MKWVVSISAVRSSASWVISRHSSLKLSDPPLVGPLIERHQILAGAFENLLETGFLRGDHGLFSSMSRPRQCRPGR